MGIAAGATVACSGLLNGCQGSGQENPMNRAKPKYQQYKNEDFYNADGTFEAEKARQAYYEMMEYFNSAK